MPKPRGIPALQTPAFNGKQWSLPPKSPGPAIPPSILGSAIHPLSPSPAVPPPSPVQANPPPYAGYNSSPSIGFIGIPRPREGSRHQRTSSESILVEEQLAWLDDLLDEPDTTGLKGVHRRSSSDSSAYVDLSYLSPNSNNVAFENLGPCNITPKPSWISESFDHLKRPQHSHQTGANSFKGPQNRRKDASLSTADNLSNSDSNPSPIPATKELEALTSNKQDQEESAQGLQGSSDKREESHAKQTEVDMEPKRTKQ